MMNCFITRTGSYLPGPAVENSKIQSYLGSVEGDDEVRDLVLSMNGITQRHYAQDTQQKPTEDVYDLGANAVKACLGNNNLTNPVTYLSTGTTYAPLAAPGYASILHHRLQQQNCLSRPVEVSAHSGICSSAAGAMVAAVRAVDSGHHHSAICVGAEHSSEVLKAGAIAPVDDRDQHESLRNTKWFNSMFLRFMLSDGAGAFLLQDQPISDKLSLQVNWTHSLSFANEAPLCMQLENQNAQLSQDLSVLSRYLFPCARKFLSSAMQSNDDRLDSYSIILPHMSSFFFRRKMENVIAEACGNSKQPVSTSTRSVLD